MAVVTGFRWFVCVTFSVKEPSLRVGALGAQATRRTFPPRCHNKQNISRVHNTLLLLLSDWSAVLGDED